MTRSTPAAPLKLHSHPLSGHSHKVRLFLSLLGLPFETVDVDIPGGEHRRPDFLRLNAFGLVPVLEDGDRVVTDSNAILVYLAERYAEEPGRWLPRDPFALAQVQRWLSVSSGPLYEGPNKARLINLFKQDRDPAEVLAGSARLLDVMESELANRPWLAGDAPTLADIANYSYVSVAPEGGISLDAYPRLREWIARVEALPGFVPMPVTPIGLRA
jgi:glutathione S-transferase